MKQARHLTPSPSRWRRKILGLPVVVWLMGLAGVAVAVAGFLVLLNVSGTVTADAGLDIYYTGTGVGPSNEGTGSTCGGSVLGPDEINLTMGSLSGESEVCKFVLNFQNDGGADAWLQSFDLTSGDFAGGEIVASVETCGYVVPGGGGVGTVAVFLDAGSVLPGQTFTFVPGEDGLVWTIPSQYNAGACAEHS